MKRKGKSAGAIGRIENRSEKEISNLKTIIIAIASHKGGVGKSSIIATLAFCMSKYFRRILVLDFDSQANTTWMMCPDPTSVTRELSDIFEFGNKNSLDDPANRKELKEIFRQASTEVSRNGKSVRVVVSSLRLGQTQMEMRTSDNYALFRARDIVKCLAEDFDLVLIDTPPSLEFFPNAAVASSDYLIIPMTPDALAVQGGQDTIMHVLSGAKKYFNENVRLLGIVVNKYHKAKVSDVMLKLIREQFGKMVFNTIVSRSARVEEVTTYRAPLGELSPDSKSNIEFESFADELYERLMHYEKE